MKKGVSSWMGGGAREDGAWTRLDSKLPDHPFQNTVLLARGVPLFVWPLLAAAVFAVSSAATAFSQMADVPAVTLAAWRLQLTSLLLFIGAVWQWKTAMGREEQQRSLRSWPLLLLSGCCLALHFGAWVWGLQHTSLTHSLTLVCAVPVVLAVGTLGLRLPISKGEVVGAAVGVLGGLLLSLGPHSRSEDGRVSLMGDLASLAAAVAFIGYLLVGRRLRQWMPIFVYACPVTSLAALLLSLASLILDGSTPSAAGAHGTLGWLADRHYAPWVVYLAVVPGIVGHTGFNTLLRYLTSLTVCLACQLEPLVGSLIGWAAGLVGAPGWATWTGGLLMVAGTCMASAGNALREQRQAQRDTAALELGNVLAFDEEECEEEHALLRATPKGPWQGAGTAATASTARHPAPGPSAPATCSAPLFGPTASPAPPRALFTLDGADSDDESRKARTARAAHQAAEQQASELVPGGRSEKDEGSCGAAQHECLDQPAVKWEDRKHHATAMHDAAQPNPSLLAEHREHHASPADQPPTTSSQEPGQQASQQAGAPMHVSTDGGVT